MKGFHKNDHLGAMCMLHVICYIDLLFMQTLLSPVSSFFRAFLCRLGSMQIIDEAYYYGTDRCGTHFWWWWGATLEAFTVWKPGRCRHCQVQSLSHSILLGVLKLLYITKFAILKEHLLVIWVENSEIGLVYKIPGSRWRLTELYIISSRTWLEIGYISGHEL